MKSEIITIYRRPNQLDDHIRGTLLTLGTTKAQCHFASVHPYIILNNKQSLTPPSLNLGEKNLCLTIAILYLTTTEQFVIVLILTGKAISLDKQFFHI